MASHSEWEKGPFRDIESDSDPKVRDLIDLARAEASASIEYIESGQATEKRLIFPKRVFQHIPTGRIYVEAFCNTAKDMRNFRIDRLFFLK